MKRLLMLLFAAFMAISIIGCSAATDKPAPNAASKAPEVTTPPKQAEAPKAAEPKAPAEAPKAEDPKAPAEAPKAGETKPAEAPKAEETKAPAEASKAPAEAPKAAEVKAPAETPKAAEPAAPTPAPAPASAPKQEEISAKGKKVLLVGREKAGEDIVVSNRLKALGFAVTIMPDKNFTADKTNGYDLIYISQTLNSKMVKDGVMKDVAIPTVYVKNHGMYYLGLSSIEENANIFNVKSIDIVDSNHKVAGGLSGTVDIYKETGPKMGIGYGLPGKEAKIIATGPGDKSKATIYYYDKGTKADDGYAVKARISFFYLNNQMEENTTADGWKLLDNLVLWTLQNG
ncbi:hypothetical protein [Paenibacillus radicis (ex Xue et al. 2023)]|uniref:Uncharacterized protein n=1 Tax=Paenibacillus radicis (ex Xue et al. 2023) TaxID=2972489 RepID=A0ABT1YDK6_9BACL|nr:hypothetical protein [Paenibacillus radicis (ex Xue et al. 2023)]MCR8631267.1 hypothetical protein [Paenibacillus radicis (ex Xue et al. 2023)]